MTDSLLAEDLTPQLDDTKNYLADLVGEGKKFRTAEELARGKYESDSYIETMKRRQDELREDYLKLKADYDARAKLEELLDLNNIPRNQPKSNELPLVTDKESPKLDPKEIESLVSKQIQEHESNRKQTDNFNIVKNKLIERYGRNYQTVLADQISELGLTEADVDALARKSPNAFFKTMGLDQPVKTENFQAPPRTQQRSDNFAPRGEKKRSWSYYQELKKSNPRLYLDPKIAVQMHKDAQEMGEAFYDGDFGAYEH